MVPDPAASEQLQTAAPVAVVESREEPSPGLVLLKSPEPKFASRFW